MSMFLITCILTHLFYILFPIKKKYIKRHIVHINPNLGWNLEIIKQKFFWAFGMDDIRN